MKGLEQLRKNSKPILIKMAKNLNIKVGIRWNKVTLAKKILEKQKLKELDDTPVQPGPEAEPESGKPERKPNFERLATEGPDDAPESPQVDEVGPGGYRPGSGRPLGATAEKVRLERIVKNQVPDPAIEFVVECIFNLSGAPRKQEPVEPEPKNIALPITNLMSYYFPNLNLTPILRVWFDLGIAVKNLVVSRVQPIKKTEPVAEQPAEPVAEEPKT